MSQRNLEHLLHPRSVALIGASERPGSVGTVVLRNLLAGGFQGAVFAVNPKYETLAGNPCYPGVDSLPETPDLAVICTPAASVPPLISALGARGTRAAVILSAGLSAVEIEPGRDAQRAALEAARPHLLRILGPNTVGLVVPAIGLNASFAHTGVLPGSLAFVAQSGAMCTAVLDWAHSTRVGFSHVLAVGNSSDVDVGDLLDYLGSDPNTQAILMYLEAITEARKFMSAARSASRNKPVIAIKAGRAAEGARAAASHTGALAGDDAVYEAALRRAGILRVEKTEELFEAAETLARSRALRGEKLAVISNGGGPGVLAADALVASGGTLSPLSEETVRRLDALLPRAWSRANPIDVIGDATAGRYGAALRILLEDEAPDAILAMFAPNAVVTGIEVARALVDAVGDAERPLLTCWLGRDGAAESRRLFAERGLPTYETPEEAVRGFMHLVRYQRNREILMATPPSLRPGFAPDTAAARRVIAASLAEGRPLLSEPEAKAVLAAYEIPVVETRTAPDAREAARLAERIGFPVALKILSPDVTHKSDVGGVALDLDSAAAVRAAAATMQARLEALRAGARLSGFAVQRMARRPGAHELIVGAATDPVFGPVVLFGQGGTAVEIIGDRTVGLPPLDMALARDMVARTRVWRLLRGYRGRPAADLDGICLTLARVAQMVIDLPEIAEIDINPLLADENGVLALDARLRADPAGQAGGATRLAIRPYPAELEEHFTLRLGRRVLMRPIRPEDEPAHHSFLSRLTPEDIRFRFFGLVKALPHSQMARFTQIDYDREMAFIATAPARDGSLETLGVVRTATDADNRRAEFAIVVRSDIKGQGLGRALLEKMLRYCGERGTAEVVGQVLADNSAMLDLAAALGFESRSLPGRGIQEVCQRLHP
jgi:acetyltransferase